MTTDLLTLQIFAVIGFITVAVAILGATAWILAQVGHWLDR